MAAYQRRGDVQLPPDHVAFLRRTEIATQVGGFAFVHADLDTRQSVAENLARPGPSHRACGLGST